MEEERGLSLRDIFKIIGKRIVAVVVITLVGVLAVTAVLGLWYNRKKQSYTVSYELTYPNSDKGEYPDGTEIIASDFISKSTLTDIKNGVYSAADNKDEFKNVDVDKIVKEADASVNVAVSSNADGSITRKYTVSVKAKYFSGAQQGESFVRVIVDYPINRMLSIIEDNKYGQYLSVYAGATTYEDAINALVNQKAYLSEIYSTVSAMGGSAVTENVAKLSNILTDVQRNSLNARMEAYFYIMKPSEYITEKTARKTTLQREIANNNAVIAGLKAERDELAGSGSLVAINSYDERIAALTVSNENMSKEMKDINDTLDAIEKYTTEGTDEYAAKQEFDAQLNGYRDELVEATATLKSTLTGIYSSNARVVYMSNIKTTGGINIIIGAVAGAAVGFLIAAFAVCIIDGEKYKNEKYSRPAQPAAEPVKAEEEEKSEIKPAEESEEKLITVTSLIGEIPEIEEKETSKEEAERQLDALIMSEVAITAVEGAPEVKEEEKEEPASIEAPAEQPAEAPAEQPAEKPAPAKKPAAKKPAAKSTATKSSSTKSTATKSTAAKSTATKSTATKPAAAKKPAAKKTEPKTEDKQ